MKFVDKIILIIKKFLRFVTCLLLKKFSIFQIHHFIILFPIFVLAYFLFLLCCLLRNICLCLISIFLYFHCIAVLSFAGTIVKVTAKKGKKAVKKTLTFKATVKNPTIKLTSDSEIAIGTTTQIKATVKPSTAKVTYTSSDEKIATVDATSGVVTGVATGDVTIKATVTSGKATATAEQKISVKKAILKSATQAEYNKIDVVILGDTKDMKASDFVITNNATHATTVVKSVAAKKNVTDTYTLETYTGMTDAKEYTVEFAGAKTTFTATDGTVAKVGLSTVEIAAATVAPIKMTTLDKDGIVLSYTDLNNSDKSKGKVTADVKLTKGYTSGTNMYLPSVGDTATVKVTYHTGTFGTDGKEAGNIEDTFTVTAIDPSLINLNYAVTVGDTTFTPAWTANSFKANTNVKLGAERYAYFYIKDENNVEISDYTAYTVESADKTKLLVTEGKLSNKTTAVAVKGVAEGSTYVLVKKAGKVVASLPVSVVAKPVATTLDLDKTSVTVALSADVDQNVKLTLKDQYNDEMTITGLDIALLGKPNDKSDDIKSAIDGSAKNKVVVNAKSITSKDDNYGTYTFKLTAKNGTQSIDRTLAVNVVKKDAVQSYELMMNQSEVDTTISAGTDANFDITIKVAEMANGAAVEEYSASDVEYTITNAKNETIAKVGKSLSAKDVTTGAAVSANISDNNLTVNTVSKTTSGSNISSYVKNLSAGQYNVTAKFTIPAVGKTPAKDVTCVGSFTIKDTQDTKVTYEIPDYDFASKTVAVAFADKTLVKVFYDGVEQYLSTADIDKVHGTALTNGGAYVKTVDVYVTLSGTSKKVLVPVTINHVIEKCDVSGIVD